MGSEPPLLASPPRLSGIAPFSELDDAARASMASRLERRAVHAGELVIEEGSAGTCMYLIAEGAFRVERHVAGKDPRVVAEMGAGEFFGEMSLLSGAPRLASVVAAGDGSLLRLERRDLDALVATHPRVGEVVERFHKERLVANIERASPLFRVIVEGQRRALAQVVRVEAHEGGALLLEEGQPARGFFILLRGTCEVFHRAADGKEKSYPPLHEGDVFGEISLLQDLAITANVRTQTPCVVLSMAREWFDQLVLRNPTVRSEIYALAGERFQRTRELVACEELERHLI